MELQIPHIVFAPKYIRKVFYADKRLEIGAILRELCKWKGVNILEAEVCPDHIHMLLEIPPNMSISSVMGFLKGKSSLMIYEKWGNLKFKYRNREFWCIGYYVDTAWKNVVKIKEYIKNQLKEDELREQLTFSNTVPCLWVASNNLFASARSCYPPLEAASRTGLCLLKKYPQLGWGMLIILRKLYDRLNDVYFRIRYFSTKKFKYNQLFVYCYKIFKTI